jgi:fructose-bisphosphate aldolase class I
MGGEAANLDRDGVLGTALSAALQYEAGCKRLAADTRFPPTAISRAYLERRKLDGSAFFEISWHEFRVPDDTLRLRASNESARETLQMDDPGNTETKMSNFDQQMQKIKTQPGFIAALDQSGGSTPGALRLYGIKDGTWSNDEEMLALVHQMRTRIITSPSFTGARILAAILFENTMDRDIDKQPTADYLWDVKRVVPFLKVDKGLEAEKDGVQLMKPAPQLAALLEKARSKRIFGTKMRSVIKQANPDGVKNIVKQQFEWATQISAAGLVPIIEPEVDIHCPDKSKAEELLKAGILAKLNEWPASSPVMLKLTLPDRADFYADFVGHQKVVRVVALSGGYSQKEANDLLRNNHGIVASFSRALLEGLTAQQSDAEFNAVLDASIQSIFEASIT